MIGGFGRLTGGTGDMAEAQAKNADPGAVSAAQLTMYVAVTCLLQQVPNWCFAD